jgi:hypothetical protein
MNLPKINAPTANAIDRFCDQTYYRHPFHRLRQKQWDRLSMAVEFSMMQEGQPYIPPEPERMKSNIFQLHPQTAKAAGRHFTLTMGAISVVHIVVAQKPLR